LASLVACRPCDLRDFMKGTRRAHNPAVVQTHSSSCRQKEHSEAGPVVKPVFSGDDQRRSPLPLGGAPSLILDLRHRASCDLSLGGIQRYWAQLRADLASGCPQVVNSITHERRPPERSVNSLSERRAMSLLGTDSDSEWVKLWRSIQ